MDRNYVFMQLAYLAAVILFVVGLKRLSSPRTARVGNLQAALGMFLAVLATLVDHNIISFWFIGVGIAIGSAIGYILAVRVQMTQMPQMVALLNGFGGLGSAAVGISEYLLRDGWSSLRASENSLGEFAAATAGSSSDLQNTLAAAQHMASALGGMPAWVIALSTGLSILIGCVTFTGSFVAFGKLQGLKFTPSSPVTFPGRMAVTGLALVLSVALTGYFALEPAGWVIVLLTLLTLGLGFLLVLPIGGADMPVVISLLNSYSGMAACATGFVLNNNLLVVAGALVGASGIILTQIMCKAMNRSLLNVLVGGFGGESVATSAKGGAQRTVTDYTAEDAAGVLDGAREVVIVPGYGLAVAQAQHAVRELEKALEAKGSRVRYAIHPVAGRMPGHMNVLLAEADVPYEKLLTMEEINPEFPQVDVVLVLGANDVINPAARDEKGSPIYGMPILEVDKAGTVMIVKRSLASGYAGIDNELFYAPKTMMLFGDAKKMVHGLTAALAV